MTDLGGADAPGAQRIWTLSTLDDASSTVTSIPTRTTRGAAAGVAGDAVVEVSCDAGSLDAGPST